MSTARCGWAGKVLRVDLGSGATWDEDSDRYVEEYLGGKGLGQAVIFDEIPASAGALEPGNVLVFSAGPLVGTLAPASARLNIDAKNPVTGGTASSNAGGHFAPELKYAGYDAIIVKGRSPAPVYLQIVDGNVALRPAAHLWGQGTSGSERTIRREMGEPQARLLSIGPAGENQTRSACIIVDGARAAGRGALGAVMGSKNLKAIAVRGTGRISAAWPEQLVAEAGRCWGLFDDNQTVRSLRTYGTPGSIPKANLMCRLPVRNFQDDHWDDSRIDGALPERFLPFRTRKLACFNCPLYCSTFYQVNDGEYAGVACEGIQANLVWDFMSKLDMNEPAAALRIQELCSDLGLDIDNSSGAIAWAMECWEKGLLTARDTGGIELTWGNHHAIIDLLLEIAHRRGFGSMLSDGARAAAQRLGRGSEYYAAHVKGQELAESIRALKAWGLGTVVAPRGGGHLDGALLAETWQLSPEESVAWFGVPSLADPTAYEGKARAVFWFERFKAVVDMLGICYFATRWLNKDLLGPERLAALFSAVVGRHVSAGELMDIGQRVHNLEKAFNTLHAGFSRQDDLPPARLTTEPIQGGRFAGERLDPSGWSLMLDEYYSLHGWDCEGGRQTRSGLLRLGMDKVADRLAGCGRLLEA